jgi:hypothetical protein
LESKLIQEIELAEYLSTSGPKDYENFHLKELSAARNTLDEFWRTLPDAWHQYGNLRRGIAPDPTTILSAHSFQEPVHLVWVYASAERLFAWHRRPDGTLHEHFTDMSAEFARRSLRLGLLAAQARAPLPVEWRTLQTAVLQGWLGSVPAGEIIIFIPSGDLHELPFPIFEFDGGLLLRRNPILVSQQFRASHIKTVARGSPI